MPTYKRRQRMAEVASARQAGLVIVLEDIHDPHNVEAALRSCDAFGVYQVHLVFVEEPVFNPRRIGKSSSSSANKWIEFTTHHSTSACIDLLRSNGHTLVATSPNRSAIPLPDAPLNDHRMAIWFGNEHRGLSKIALSAADISLTIPLTGMVRSINVSVAVAITLYEASRQRQGHAYTLDQAAINSLAQDYLRR